MNFTCDIVLIYGVVSHCESLPLTTSDNCQTVSVKTGDEILVVYTRAIPDVMATATSV